VRDFGVLTWKDAAMKALVGSWDNRPHRVLAELTALRTQVAELQAELAAARAENEALRRALDVRHEVSLGTELDDAEVVLSGR
jgi:regulator of replication initiation timing